MGTMVEGWTTLAEEPLVLLREYSFGVATANALAVRLPNRKLLMVSAPVGLTSDEQQALAAEGEVVALIANNGAHHMGLAAWQKAFPSAVPYATASARDRIRKKSKYSGPLEPMEALEPQLGDKICVTAADGCKSGGDVLVRVETEHGSLLYAGDFIANIPAIPNFLFRLVFKLTDSGPGLKVFRIYFIHMASDSRALRDFLIRELEAHPPAILVPGHGDTVARPDLGPTLVAMLRKAIK